MKKISFIVFVTVPLVFGCRKAPDAASTPPPVAAADTPAAPGDTQAAAVPEAPPPPSVLANADNSVSQTAVAGDVDNFLTQQLRIFVDEKQRMPTSFTEFRRARLDGIPRPPEGKKWIIDAANVQVKAVPR